MSQNDQRGLGSYMSRRWPSIRHAVMGLFHCPSLLYLIEPFSLDVSLWLRNWACGLAMAHINRAAEMFVAERYTAEGGPEEEGR